MAMKPSSINILIISLLAVVLATLQAEAQIVQPIAINIGGSVFCTVNATTNTTAPPFANALVNLQCGQNVIASALTDPRGQFSISVNPGLVSLPTLFSNCTVRVVTPLARCNASLPTGILQGAIQFVGVTRVGLLGVVINLAVGLLNFIGA